MPTIQKLTALEILDSRGRPTVQATCILTSGSVGTVSVPSGASTGSAEALELRDGDPTRFRGLGCLQAVNNIQTLIHSALRGEAFEDQQRLDERLIALDGTENKSGLGANAILAVSLAFARACAYEQGIALYPYFAHLLGEHPTALPRLTINLFSGGKHAGGQVAIQDVLIVPLSAKSIRESLAIAYEIYQTAAELIAEEFGMRALSADEGGLAPNFASAEEMLDYAIRAIERAGFRPGEDVALAVDVASTQFYVDGTYHLGQDRLSSQEMIERLTRWVDTYPIISLEDGLAENDWGSWGVLANTLASKVLVLGDDFLCTNPQRIQRAITDRAANALLLKVNQIGTVSEALQAQQLARSAGWHVTISARSGDTEDHWLADLAVGWGGNHIKIGSITQSERLAKYNRLLVIEAETDLPLIGQ